MELTDIIDINLAEAYQSVLPGLVAGLVFRFHSIKSKQEISQKMKFGTAVGANILVDSSNLLPYSPLKHDSVYNVLNDFGGVAGFFFGIKVVDFFYYSVILIKEYLKEYFG